MTLLLTKRQEQVLRAFVDLDLRSGAPATIRELMDALSIKSTNGINDHLLALQNKGYLERRSEATRSRNLKLTLKGAEWLARETAQ